MHRGSRPEQPVFERVQRQFARHIRDPEHAPAPAGIEDRRLAIYRDLFFSNIESFVAGAFPVLRAITPERQWREMIRDFMRRHRCRTPYFLEISQEFLRYLEVVRGEQAGDPPFLLELAHYEWVELALDVSEEEPDWQGIDANGDLLSGRPVISPVAWSLRYRFPVHRIGPGFLPADCPAEPTCLLVYRDREDEVKFIEINAVTARLLAIVAADETLSAKQAILQLARELRRDDTQSLLAFGLDVLRYLQRQGVVLGVRSAAA